MSGKPPKPNNEGFGADLSDPDSMGAEPAAPRRGADYEVGYGRPPKHTQFKPGKSGNLKGRSPQLRNLKTILKQVLDEPMPIPEGGRVRRMTKAEALVRMTYARALKGDPKALASLIILMKQFGYGTEAVENTLELLRGVDHQAILEEYLTRLAVEGPTEFGSSSDDSAEDSDPSKKGKA